MAACLGAPTFSVSNEGVSRRREDRAAVLSSLRRDGRRPARGPPVTSALGPAAAAQPLLVSIRDSDLLPHPPPIMTRPVASPFPISSPSSSSGYSCATTTASNGGGTATSVKVKSAVDDDDVGDDDLNEAIKKGRNILATQQDILQRIIELRTIDSSLKDNDINLETEASSGTDADRGEKEKTSFWKPQIGTSAADSLSLNKETDSAIPKGKILSTLLPCESRTDGSPDEKLPELSEEGTVDVNILQDVDTDEENASNPPLTGSNVMNVILVAAECAPWSKTGGLGDVVGALPKALAKRGHRVMVVAPRYANYSEPQEIGVRRRYRVCGQDMEVTYFHAYIDGVDFVFINSPIFNHRQNDIYGGERQDILKQMVLLCKSAVEVPWHVPCGGVCYGDGNLVFVANDWHTALLPVYLRAYYRDNGLMKYTRSVLVIHNIAHQGRGPMDDFGLIDLPQHYNDIFKVYDPIGGEHLNIFAAGLRTTDRIVTVSHGYTWELKTSEGGWGLDEIINENDWKLQGILNGIDTNDWNPELDVHLKADGYTNYTFDTLKTGKSQCKAALQKELGLPVRDNVPFIGFIGRLDHQKGIDIIAEAIPWMVSQDMQLVMLGTGRADLEEMLKKFENQYYDKVRGWVGFSVKVAHRIIAGADILLMPSRFEPCGLNQLYAMKYGTIPVVHAVGGLRDTVIQFDPFKETGFGWTFDRAEPQKLINAMGHCLNTYWNYKKSWDGLQRRGMMQDLSWNKAAEHYEEVLLKAKYQW